MNEAKRHALRALQESMDRRDNGGPAGLPDGTSANGTDSAAEPADPHHEAEQPTHNGVTVETAEAETVDVWAAARQREFATVS